MIAVQCVAASAEIIIFSLRRKDIVNIIIKSLETEIRSIFISFCRMIEYNIQNNLDSIFVELPDQFLQLPSFFLKIIQCRIIIIWRKVTDSIIPPVLQKRVPVDFSGIDRLVKFKYRHQFHRVDAELFQIRNFFLQSLKSSSMLHIG